MMNETAINEYAYWSPSFQQNKVLSQHTELNPVDYFNATCVSKFLRSLRRFNVGSELKNFQLFAGGLAFTKGCVILQG
jgi:hypothetical protein